MNILLVSECSGRAINETRRILDQFAERRGERTWQTPVTRDGLDALRKLLRKSARKNTAVACHWIRGLNHSELLWIVGDRRRFNAEGAVPTNRTRRDVLRSSDENDWHTGEDISLLAQLAALLHDLGKASIAFQIRLKSSAFSRNLYRHEWVSLRMFLAFVGSDDDEAWLRRLASPGADDDASWLASGRYWRDGIDEEVPKAFAGLPPLAAAVAWLVVTHHRLLTLPVSGAPDKAWFGKRSSDFAPEWLDDLWLRVDAGWNDWSAERDAASRPDIERCWTIAGALPPLMPKWRRSASKLAQRLLALRSKPGKGDWLSNPYVMHVARMGLMLADHHYSSLPPDSSLRVSGDIDCDLFANTDRNGQLKQRLDEHLLGVARDAAMLCHGLQTIAENLPVLQHRALRKRTATARFRWQDKAFDAAEGIRDKAAENGAFIVNMASTGRGKTFANARIMYGLADPHRGMRCSFAVGLRTLTLQMGRNYRDILGVGDDELAVRVGGSASRQLFEYHAALAESTGSASTQALIEEDGAVFYEGNVQDHPLLRMAMGDERIRNLLSAPLLVCTIDHLMPATEAQRAGRQIAPMLRLMSSDLVLDEPDDFGIDDFPALTRLVHWAGLLGSRVLLSSATLPPALVQGLFEAYRQGRIQYQRNRGSSGGQASAPPSIPCLWVDEFKTVSQDCAEVEGFAQSHEAFVHARIIKLAAQPPKQLGQLLPLRIDSRDKSRIRAALASQVVDAALDAHQLHAQIDPVSGKRVSFGLVRMANIDPLFDVAQEVFRLGAPDGVHIHLCVYHSRFPLLLRSAIEENLDAVLGSRGRRLELPDIRRVLDHGDEQEHLFVVLASPVAEVGRDHDYDWAIVEPSSMRSLIQLAGRVRRHRDAGNSQPNIFVFETNLKHFEQPGKPAFVRPGFEHPESPARAKVLHLASHFLGEVLDKAEYATIDARPRIQSRPIDALKPTRSLVDLEHVRMLLAMGQSGREHPNATTFFRTDNAHLTWALPQQQPFRDDSQAREQTLVFLPDEEEEQLLLHRVDESRLRRNQEGVYTLAQESREQVRLEMGPRIAPWMEFDMLELLQRLAEAQRISLMDAGRRFTTVSVPKVGPDRLDRWRWHPLLGMTLAK
ncbi:MAG: type I-F CRISPR-associated helicase Cas3f [Pseudoxanthomonas suwonensis]|nr:type I-F CRISPR-associated helicase Cas3f [Pseudoxanthomonas suwonensis]